MRLLRIHAASTILTRYLNKSLRAELTSIRMEHISLLLSQYRNTSFIEYEITSLKTIRITN